MINRITITTIAMMMFSFIFFHHYDKSEGIKKNITICFRTRDAPLLNWSAPCCKSSTHGERISHLFK